MSTTTAFEDVISAWGKRLHCEITVKGGGRYCQRPASWRLNVHGCESFLICTGHLRDWWRRANAVLVRGGCTTCGLCGEKFTSMPAICRVIHL